MKKFVPTTKLDYDEKEPSFALRTITVFTSDCAEKVKILLPTTHAVDELVKERSAAANQEADAHSEAEMELAEKARADRAAKTKVETAAPYVSPDRKKKLDRAFVDRARVDLLQKFEELTREQDLLEEKPRDTVPVYAWDEPVKMLELALAVPDDLIHARDMTIYEGLKKRGNYRRVLSDEGLDRALDALRAIRSVQPHFVEVIDFVKGQLLMRQELGHPISIPPILIVGPPGVGKTHFTLELARGLERYVHRHNFDSSHTASSLTGSARNWGNTSMGLVFQAVCMSDRADPVILLDEIDKSVANRYYSALAPLHSLLEPLTSDKVTDISVGITFDARHVTWVATANYFELVPATVASRFRVFHIDMPDAAQAIELATGVAAAVHVRYNGFELPSRSVVTMLAHLTPREQTQALDHAFSRALLNGRKHLIRQDLPVELLDADEDRSPDERSLH